ncbi:MAG: type II toxin-antitoxin system RelE/ParE family toxin [Bacteroidales bacterium]|nr:type II toxin-antitoxin system RelE/ParE family toxin [Bacteroidales bacterium]
MELTVYWTEFAEDKLEDVFSYFIEKVSLRFAQQLVDEIIDRSLELATNPLMGQKEILLADRIQDFRYLVYKNYKIIYWLNIKRNRIEIVNLFDCRQNPQKMNEI